MYYCLGRGIICVGGGFFMGRDLVGECITGWEGVLYVSVEVFFIGRDSVGECITGWEGVLYVSLEES